MEDRQRVHEHERMDREAQRWRFEDAARDAARESREAKEEEEGGEGTEEASFESFCKSFDFEINAERLPAVMERSDGETLLYSGKLNSVFGTPGCGKSWVAIIAIPIATVRGGNVMLLDFEDSKQTFKRRAVMLGFDPEAYAETFRYPNPAMMGSKAAIAQAQEWLVSASEPTQSLVVIDAAESAGCPSDGAPVAPWFKSHVEPWREVGAGVLIVDHIPKRAEDRPRGAIGSTHKLSRIDGAALMVSGAPWTKKANGKIFLTVHKDRGGDLPAPVGKCVAVIEGTYKGADESRAFAYAIEPPEPQDDGEDLQAIILAAVADAGDSGVTGARAMRALVKGKGQATDATIAGLVDAGMLVKTPRGKAHNYAITRQGLALLETDD